MKDIDLPVLLDHIYDLEPSATDAAPTHAVLIVTGMTGRAAAYDGFGLKRCYAVPGGMVEIPVVPAEFHAFN